MVFSSVIFLFGFLPVFLCSYLLLTWLNKKNNILISRSLLNIFILISSILFYVWGEKYLVFVMLMSTFVDFFSAKIIEKGFKKTGLLLSIITNLSLLGFFKYSSFMLMNINYLLTINGISGFDLPIIKAVTLPLGISFYTFQSMSYTIDVYRGKVKVSKNILDFTSFVTMFPQLVAGPIVRYADVANQLSNRVLTTDGFTEGIKRFIIGLAKKVLIANTVATACDSIFSLDTRYIDFSLSWVATICYTLQIYFDFSGYSDMAIGLGKMIGFDFPENFNYPYISKSIKEFWRRWHISLSTWFRDYLYIPLGGNKKSNSRTYLNLLIVFFLCGLWHGASWTFVIWGLYHGFFLIIERILPIFYNESKSINVLKGILLRGYALLVVMIGWILFRSESLLQAKIFIAKLLGFGFDTKSIFSVWEFVQNDVLLAMIFGVAFSTPLVKSGVKLLSKYNYYFYLKYASLSVLFYLCILKLSSATYNPFIYFRF